MNNKKLLFYLLLAICASFFSAFVVFLVLYLTKPTCLDARLTKEDAVEVQTFTAHYEEKEEKKQGVFASLLIYKPFLSSSPAYYLNSFATAPVNTYPRNFSFPVNVGFNLGYNRKFIHNDWKIGADYTYFFSSNENNDTAVHGIVANQGVLLNGQLVSTAKDQGNVWLNKLNLAIEKEFHFYETVQVGAGIGVSTNYLSIQKKATFSGGYLGADEVFIVNKTQSFAIGPLGQILAKWILYNQFYITTKGSLALEYLSSAISYRERRNLSIADHLMIKNNYQGFVPNLFIDIGLGKIFAPRENIVVDAAITYQADLYWNEYVHYNVVPLSSTRIDIEGGNAFFQGACFRVSLSF